MHSKFIILVALYFVIKCKTGKALAINQAPEVSVIEYEDDNEDDSGVEMVDSGQEVGQSDAEVDNKGNYVGYPVSDQELKSAQEVANPLQSDDDDVPDIPDALGVEGEYESVEDQEPEDASKQFDMNASGYPDLRSNSVRFDDDEEQKKRLQKFESLMTPDNVQHSPQDLAPKTSQQKPKMKVHKFEDLYPQLMDYKKRIRDRDSHPQTESSIPDELESTKIKLAEHSKDKVDHHMTKNMVVHQNPHQIVHKSRVQDHSHVEQQVHLARNAEHNAPGPMVHMDNVVIKPLPPRASDSHSAAANQQGAANGKLLVPKRERRILARYKVIIPVIVPNLRVRAPRKHVPSKPKIV